MPEFNTPKTAQIRALSAPIFNNNPTEYFFADNLRHNVTAIIVTI
jgi:uncharacterized protein YqkB